VKIEPTTKFLSILYFYPYSKIRKNGVQRFAEEIVKGIALRNPSIHVIFWNREKGLFKSYGQMLKDFFKYAIKSKVIHFVVLTPYNIPFMIMARLLGKKVVITYHGNYKINSPFTKNPFIYTAFGISDIISRLVSDKMVSPSEYLATQMNMKKSKTSIIPNPTDLFSSGIMDKNEHRPNEIMFVTASNFNIKQKVTPLVLFLDAINDLSKKSNNLKIYVFGDGIYLKEFKAKYEKTTNIFFMGFTNDYPRYLNQADIYAHISGFDNQPYALLDALSLGKVILCNDIGGLLEMLEPNNNYIVKLDKSSIILALEQILEEIKSFPQQFKDRGIKNREFALRRYSSDIISSKYLRLYAEMLKPIR
jgi:glycosyltransferase involved in cell wall biosynthesis